MADFNRVLLMGRLTRDPDLRYTPSGTAVADFNMAINRSYSTAEGVNKRESCFVDVTVWRRLAEVSANTLKRGNSVFVEGRLHLDTWSGKGGEKRSKLRVIAENIQFLDKIDDRDSASVDGAPESFEF